MSSKQWLNEIGAVTDISCISLDYTLTPYADIYSLFYKAKLLAVYNNVMGQK